MKILTQLSKISPDSYIAKFSDGAELKLSLSTVTDFSLYSGRELSPEEYAALKNASALDGAKALALRLINSRAMSKKELIGKLTDKGESEENARAAADWLSGMHFLDDEAYGKMVVRHYGAKGYGPARIKNELYRRGVPKELWDGALEDLPEQDDKIDRLLRSRLRSVNPDKAEIKRAADALFRRGFSWDEINSALERFRQEHGED